MTRRQDIDGLRAIAIALVLVFHCFPNLLPGGFVGVDVFFVISGYLITNGLRRDFDARRFSAARFYVRRARRLLPALLVVLLASAALAWPILFQPERRALGAHILSALRFGSNFTLMGEAGYFDRLADLKPLLHLWSLAIEEQFYFVLPLVLWATGRRAGPWLLVLLAASLIWNGYLFVQAPDTMFFHPLVRFWEPLAGGALAWSARAPRAWRDASASFGLALIGLTAALAGGHAAYPNGFALAVVAGTLLVIWGGPETRVARALSGPALRVAGDLSYPLYLWHWPLLAFARSEFGLPLSNVGAALTLVASVGLAALTHFGVERPFQRLGGWTQATALATAALALFAVGQAYNFQLRDVHPTPPSMALHKASEGLIGRLCGLAPRDADVLHFCFSDEREAPTRAVWGDSKGDAIYPALVKHSRAGQRWMLLGRASCAPLDGVRRISTKSDDLECEQADARALEFLTKDTTIQFVLFVTAHRILFEEYSYVTAGAERHPAAGTEGVVRAIEAVARSGKRVGVLIDNPYVQDPELCVPRPWDAATDDHRASCVGSLAAYRAKMAGYYAFTREVQRRVPGALIIDPAADLCDVAAGVCRVTRDGLSQYSYGDHLSDFGAGRVAATILGEIDRYAVSASD